MSEQDVIQTTTRKTYNVGMPSTVACLIVVLTIFIACKIVGEIGRATSSFKQKQSYEAVVSKLNSIEKRQGEITGAFISMAQQVEKNRQGLEPKPETKK